MKACEPTIFYEMDDQKRMEYVGKVKDSIKSTDDTLLKKMMKTVQSVVQAYETDFYVHDYAMYKEAKNNPFLWIIRPHGTHYLRLVDDRFELDGEKKSWIMRHVFSSVINNIESSHVMYLCHDTKMKKITVEDAWNLLREYEDKALRREEIRVAAVEKKKQEEWIKAGL